MLEMSFGGGGTFIDSYKDVLKNKAPKDDDSGLGILSWDSTGRIAIGYRFGRYKIVKN
jgi:hypothetical protein